MKTEKKFSPMKLKLLTEENFEESTLYKFIYLEKPYGFSWKDECEINWIDAETVRKNSIFYLMMEVFEEFDKIIYDNFKFFDKYGISDFVGDDARRLAEVFMAKSRRYWAIVKKSLECDLKICLN